jgi:hypothetical protein
MRRSLALGLILLGLTGCAARSGISLAPPTPPPATPCEEVIPECHAERLPNLILGPGTPDPDGGALGPVTGSLEGVISFDEALRRAWKEGGYPGAKTVQVVLGSADPQSMHWDSDNELFYGIEWGGTCEYPSSIIEGPPATCVPVKAGTIIDALTGDFVVAGISSA